MSKLLEELRNEMIMAFHLYAGIEISDLGKRLKAWEYYCDRRESYLEASALGIGRKYLPLKATLIDTN